jgi:hypothetical protein
MISYLVPFQRRKTGKSCLMGLTLGTVGTYYGPGQKSKLISLNFWSGRNATTSVVQKMSLEKIF